MNKTKSLIHEKANNEFKWLVANQDSCLSYSAIDSDSLMTLGLVLMQLSDANFKWEVVKLDNFRIIEIRIVNN